MGSSSKLLPTAQRLRLLALLGVCCSLAAAVHHEGDFIHTSRRGQFLRVSFCISIKRSAHSNHLQLTLGDVVVLRGAYTRRCAPTGTI